METENTNKKGIKQMNNTYTEMLISEETRKTLSITSKNALLHHLNDIEDSIKDLKVYTNMPSNSGYSHLQNKIEWLISEIKNS